MHYIIIIVRINIKGIPKNMKNNKLYINKSLVLLSFEECNIWGLNENNFLQNLNIFFVVDEKSLLNFLKTLFE